ncbi:hypothetical protein BB558_002203 [Smittium angustum]|uniref:glucan endo-1,3-beta-D-glucosidase n=1 Tax=Smittium angustum TaxID=133377 RepID=A0A2U1J9A0_SMIAN|nr:hypothetical protein BB558_002203 [Smittium angustum]
MPFRKVQNTALPAPELENKSSLPTNMWWSNLVVKSTLQPIYPYPYTAEVNAHGLFFWYTSQNQEGRRYFLKKNTGWSVDFESSRKGVSYYDDLIVNYEWKNNEGTKSINVPFVKGSPYISIYFNNIKPHFTLRDNEAFITSITRLEGKSGYTVSLSNGKTWVIYCDNELELKQESNIHIVGLNEGYTGYIRFAYIPGYGDKGKTLELLSDGHKSVPERGQVTFHGNQIHHNYVTSDGRNDKLVMLALKHQKKRLTNVLHADVNTGYKTLKGDMRPIIGSNWVLNYNDINKIKWSIPKNIPSDSIEKIDTALNSETINQSDLKTRNIYFRGKALARVARLAIIAYELNNREKVNEYAALLKENIELLFNSRSDNNLVYDETYGGLITTDSNNNGNEDFGNAHYNDHNFHYGYYVYSIAALVKVMYNKCEWVEQWKPHIYSIVEEYTAIENNHRYYTKMRNFSFYDGQSWASGLVEFEYCNNMESTSEAVNSYYAAYLLYLELGEMEKANAVNLVLTSEIDSAQEYYQTSPGKIYDQEFSKNYIVGILWEPSAEYTTWFGNNDEYIYGIQMLPFTPITFSLLQKEWLNQAWPTIKSRTVDNPQISDEWKAFILMAGAMVNSDARNQLDTFVQSNPRFDSGNSKTNTVWWLEICKQI